MSLDVVSYLSAEIVLVAAALAIFMGGAFSASQKIWAPIALGAILFAAASLWSCGGNERYLQHSIHLASNPLRADSLALYGRWLALGVGAVLVLMAWRPLATGGTPEYLGSLLLIVAGLMLVASAANLVLLFAGLELISIPTYIMLSLGRGDPAGQEGAVKYFFLSILSSGILLYGLSFLYGTTGTMQIADALRQPATGFGPLFSKLAMVLIVAGLCFRVTAVPFHFYAPDVFQATIQANAAMISVLPKAAGLVALVRLVVIGMPDMGPYGWKIILAISILTMTLGNLTALWQDNVRRLFAYSSVANAGYMLIGVAVGLASGTASGFWDGIAATFFYLCVYAAATLGAFAVFAYLGRERQQVESVDELAGLARTHPVMAAALAVCMFSLAGVPPAAGIFGKVMLFGSALNVESAGGGPMRPWFIALAVIGVLNAAVAAYYYLRIVSLMYFREPLSTPRAEGGAGAYVAAIVCSLAVLVLGFYPGPLIKGCAEAGKGRGQVAQRREQGAGSREVQTARTQRQDADSRLLSLNAEHR